MVSVVKKWNIFTLGILIVFILLSGCMEQPGINEKVPLDSENTTVGSTDFGDDVLYQVSTINALLQSVYDGVESFEELKKHGDFGIGTFDALEGEMLALDGDYYQIKADGIAYPVSNDMTTPFATVTSFETDKNFKSEVPMNCTELEKYLDENLPSKNLFYAIRIDGVFPYMKTRSVPKQEKPYPKLVDVTATQSVFEFENVNGTIVGFKTPDYVKGINVPGYHLHFITEDRTAGGHVLDFDLKNGDINIDITTEFFMELPAMGDFYEVNLSQDLQSEIKIVEK